MKIIFSSEYSGVIDRDLLRMCATTSFAGRPEHENIGSFCPFTSVLSPSMTENPVSINSSGLALAEGFIGKPVIGAHFSGINIGKPSMGINEPLNIRPIISEERAAFFTESVNITDVF